MDWKHGYFAESGYTFGTYAETFPTRLAWVALLAGQITPLKQFRYLDAGCGQGLNLVLAAAAHPEAEFVGVDFLPEHIAHGQQLADAAGLKNIRFFEADFSELAADPLRYGAFDYAVCHGITTWIAPVVRDALFAFVGAALKPGGIFYNSYNTLPGWLAVSPFQHWVRLEQQRRSGQAALQSTRTLFKQLGDISAALIRQHPTLDARIKSMEGQDAAYLVQEYNNQYWAPVYFTQMQEMLARVKLSFVGTATLPDAFDSNLSPDFQKTLAQEADLHLREQLKDFLIGQSFRRDIYIKGRAAGWPTRVSRQLADWRFVRLPWQPRPEPGKPFLIKGGATELSGRPEIYNAVLDLVEQAGHEGVQIGALVAKLGAESVAYMSQVISLLMHAGWIAPLVSDANARPTNRAIAVAALEGAPYKALSIPMTGQVMPMQTLDWLWFILDDRKLPQDRWLAEAVKLLQEQGKELTHEGKKVTDPAEQEALFAPAMQVYVEQKRAALAALGA